MLASYKIYTMSPLIVKLIGAYPVKHQPIDYPNNELKIDSIIKHQNFI